MRTLKISYLTGEDVKAFQTAVTKAGFPCGLIDGVYDEMCAGSCKQFQRSQGLAEDGICGFATWKALDKYNNFTGTEHFKISEFDCHNGVAVPAQFYSNLLPLMEKLEEIRKAAGGKKVTIVSGYRTAAYNDALEGAAKSSQHLTAKAADIIIDGLAPSEVYKLADEHNPLGGVGKYDSFTHVDVRGYKARW